LILARKIKNEKNRNENENYCLLWRWPVADPDLELRWDGGRFCFALPASFPSVISSFFTKNKGGRAPPLDPPLMAQEAVLYNCFGLSDEDQR